jgi:signal transduction histidine kinase/PAS domain-containing protein
VPLAAGTGEQHVSALLRTRVAEDLPELFENLPDAVILIDRDWRLIYANRASRKVSRILPEYFGQSLWELYPDLAPELERAYREAMMLREERHLPTFYYEPWGTWYDLRILPAACGVAVLYHDTTALRQAEALRDAAAEQLREVLEASTDGVTCVDRDWRITYMNPTALGHAAPGGNPMGTNIWESYPAAVYEGSPWVKHYYQAMDQGIGSVFEAYYPEPINGWFRISVRPAKTGIIFFAQDITEQRLALDALIQSEKLAAVGRLASSIAHEINNPLEAVTNLLYLARSLARESELEAYLDKAEQQLRRVAMITNQTLRFHKQATRPQEMDCAELFSTVLSIYEGRLKNAHITVETRTRAHKPVICFEGEIRQVLANFVGNAIDAMPHGGRLLIRGREATDWRSGRAGLVLTVGDDGGGIDARTLARMFDAFFTTKGMAGTGLGLWVSAEIVARHDGRILVHSSQRPGRRGSVFTLFLPFAASPRANDLGTTLGAGRAEASPAAPR